MTIEEILDEAYSNASHSCSQYLLWGYSSICYV